MGNGFHQKMEGENLREQLASVVRSIQWSYAIFWSPSSSAESGALEWGEGYYNGDIKTRKTILAMEMNNSDQMGCQRSEQLRELYDSLLSGGADTNAQPRRPSAALSPEDLTNAEWYYLVCMSFVFRIDQGLPGKGLANGQPIWLSNAHCADTRLFCRSLLAKSAGIKTVVCFPFLSGVIELGVTDLVQEDLDLIHHVKTTFLDKKNNYSYPNILPQRLDYSFSQLRDEVLLHADLPSLMQDDYQDTRFPNNAFLVEEEAASQAQSWQLNDEELSNCVHTSMTSSDCISQAFVNPENVDAPNYLLEEELVEDHPQTSEDLNYKSIMSSLFEKPPQGIDLGMSLCQNLEKESSSFVRWRDGGKRVVVAEFSDQGSTSQKILKGILLQVPRLHQQKDDNGKQQEGRDPSSNHVLAERRRREKVNERFSVLKSFLPLASKADKISILDDTIAHLKELERRVQELDSCEELVEYNRKSKRRPQDMEERTSDNYGSDINIDSKKKKKGMDNINHNEEVAQECNRLQVSDSSTDNTIIVSIKDNDIFIDIKCPWKDSLFLLILDKLSNLHLDSHSVQSSTSKGILSLTVKSTVRSGSSSLSVGMITQELQRVLKNG